MSSLFQNAYYLAINFNAILYGTELALYGLTMQSLFQNRKKWTRTEQFYMSFSTATLCLITIYMSTEAVFGQEMWIVHADFPDGGPAGWFLENVNVWYQTLGTAASVVLNLLADALLIYRVYVVWTDIRVIAFPCLLYLATLALGILELYLSGKPNSDFFVGKAMQLGTAYWASTISLNVISTCIICGRLMYLGRAIEAARNVKGRGKAAVRYTGTLEKIIESALPYSMAGIAYLVSFGLGSDLAIMFCAFYVMFSCISPQLIIMRIVTGTAWTRDRTAETVSALEFQNLEGRGERSATAVVSDAASTVDGKSTVEAV
ncbi:hypothetical protein L226DRAFT_616431 [Lentinus tigrinus ALCF2SS1-7]|uniref:G-protein coupled receptors family 1 profile domain-containing protein n=1 Tax=Lentinus tigrinus ALCF2SS1-6 TaxID=1328759 RepID=A0A5C2RTA8_9APHY|nr:hypothetical protein L227DRAFT_580398 [Lentinus tigrinus ALCF2SS1-6]RPD70025.1 hypothetical protein L226DRAFT_616431 [Lentinus tigrinus ALCF2SS1-7]